VPRNPGLKDGIPLGFLFAPGFEFPFQCDALAQQIFNFLFARVGILSADAFSRDIASQLVQIQSDLQTLLAGHRAVAFDLFVQCRFRSPGPNVAFLPQRGYVIQPSVGGPSRTGEERLRWVNRQNGKQL
jgi:hypothetical protein